ncbi:hypothetical protein CH63R_02847 [Colletotrichum higginsianum IMI 349063]|uniref:Uncharacterized protein n=1 Tax=Colletotrichum higginsianum (strain IMI 349063) TaxID=759273 RepID=A0A1B7YQ12_COLHI|nr:hypothetical protein CH63R_02847 [Colletotrichum higginsianum IMI 349063]OBR14121.1 hypothetical protein CH63R_02847 [Colletotrichum higginsianum IMI 349063]
METTKGSTATRAERYRIPPNRILAQYRAYMRAKYKNALSAEATDADVNAIGFSEPVNNI